MATTAHDDADAALLRVLAKLVEHRWLEVDAIDAIAQLSRAFRRAVDASKLRYRTVRAHGFTARSRIRYWQLCANVPRLVAELPPGESATQAYMRLADITSVSDTAALALTGVEGEISRDVDRTFATLVFFSDSADGRRQLTNVLKATAAYAPDVAYCQGMNYVAAALLLLLESGDAVADGESQSPEETTCWLLLALIRHRGMGDVWRDNMPGLSRCIYLYNELLKTHFPALAAHLRHIGMHPSYLATQWFVTLFARVLPLPSVARVWDVFVLDGWPTLFQVALAITARISPHLLELEDMEQCSSFFRQHPRLGLEHVSPDELVAQALTYQVTHKTLAAIEDARHLEYLRLRLQQTPLSHEHAVLFPSLSTSAEDASATQTLSAIRAQLERVDSAVASDTGVLRHKIEDSDRLLAAAAAELFATSYALSEATFAFEDELAAQQRLRQQFDALLAVAIAEAVAPSTPYSETKSSMATGTATSPSLLWRPVATLAYINSRMASCLERATTRLPLLASRSHSQRSFDTSDPEDEQRLMHLELLVPQRAAELRLLQRRIDANAAARRVAQRTYVTLQRRQQLARVALEEQQQFKDRLSEQMLQLVLASEQLKTARMQELFAEVDRTASQ